MQNDCLFFVCLLVSLWCVRVFFIFHIVIEPNCRRLIILCPSGRAHTQRFVLVYAFFLHIFCWWRACMCDYLKFYLKGQKHLSSVCSTQLDLISGLKLTVPSVLLSFFSLLINFSMLCSRLGAAVSSGPYSFICCCCCCFVPTHENWPYQNRNTHTHVANFIVSIDVSTSCSQWCISIDAWT